MFGLFHTEPQGGSIARRPMPCPTRTTSPGTISSDSITTTPRRRNTIADCTRTSEPARASLPRRRSNNETLPVHPTETRIEAVQHVGPWPLKRNGSSSTTIVVVNDVRCGTPNTFSDLEQSESEFSQLMRDIDKQYDEIRELVAGRSPDTQETSTDLPNPFIVSSVPVVQGQFAHVHGQSRFSEETITVVDAETGNDVQDREVEVEGEGEVEADTRPHGLGSCCTQCSATVKRQGRYGTAGFVVIGLCLASTLASIFMMIMWFCPGGEVVVKDPGIANVNARSLFLGLLLVAILATGTPFAIALTLLCEFGGARFKSLRNTHVWTMRVGWFLVWYAVVISSWMAAFMSVTVTDVPHSSGSRGS